ncbi:MAG: FAD-binding protein [Coriobacteriales bacterium]|jgi:succinate dehydrogenase/fumarate reductase flavoprotein subunit|nr:FAD-binding protein [Coriobacteriales bacterium]
MSGKKRSEEIREESNMVSRRGFLKTAGILAAGTAFASTTACADSGDQQTPEWLPGTWEREADIVIVGMGSAGLGATIASLTEDLGEVLVLEVAPEEEAGGNSRVCGGICMVPDNPDNAILYQTDLNGSYEVPAENMQAWAEEICKNREWLEGLGAHLEATSMASPEFPECPGADAIKVYLYDGQYGNQLFWTFMKEVAIDNGAHIEYSTRVTRLITNPLTNEVLGVTSEDGRNFKARKGVVLACGGFENNQEMLNQYFRGTASTVLFQGSPYNQGDGIKMAQSVGADLWHMNNYAGIGLSVRAESPDSRKATCLRFSSHDHIFVGPDGTRFMYEERNALVRHGYMPIAGGYDLNSIPFKTYAIYGKEAFESGLTMLSYNFSGWNSLLGPTPEPEPAAYIDKGIVFVADTPRELAEKIGINPEGLENTLATYATYVENNSDPEFGKGRALFAPGEPEPRVPAFTLEAIEPPYYAMEICHTLLNSQGGPRRSPLGEVLDTEGNPILRLYAAGEMGCEYSFIYNGGGNFSEAMSSGRIAARNAATNEVWAL